MLHVIITLKLSIFTYVGLVTELAITYVRGLVLLIFPYGWRCSCIMVPNCCVVIPMYDIFVSHKQENLCSTFDIYSTGVMHFN